LDTSTTSVYDQTKHVVERARHALGVASPRTRRRTVTQFRTVDPLFCAQQAFLVTKMHSKANPRSLVFTIGFSAGVVDQLLR
jgi:hypothetical protein